MSTSRKITVYNTKGGQPKSFESSAEKWGELRAEIEGQGFNVDKLLATESVTRRDLNNVEATLPEGEFIVFLRPKKTKSGDGSHAYGYKDAKNHIKGLIETHGEDARAHFCDFKGKDYTHMSTTMLNEAITAYKVPAMKETPASDSTVNENTAQPMAEDNGVGNVVEDVKETKLTSSEKVQKAIDILEEVAQELDDDDIYDRVEDHTGELEGLKADVLELEDPERMEEERKAREDEERMEREKEEEAERLANEAENLMDGYDD